MAVAIAALVIAIAGTAVASVGTISVLTKNDKKQIKKIAGKVADQRIRGLASGLTVATAASAGTAGAAEHAKSADFAAKAGNVPEQLWAIVHEDGTLYRGSPGISSDLDEESKYVVLTNRDLSSCFLSATIGGDEPNVGLAGGVSVNLLPEEPKGVYVFTSGPGVSANRPFTLLISC
jgi:hypothetical protein